jgi:hypothetical protein
LGCRTEVAVQADPEGMNAGVAWNARAPYDGVRFSLARLRNNVGIR